MTKNIIFSNLMELLRYGYAHLRSLIKKDFTIGLDIGTASVKLAQFAEKEDGLHLVKAGLKEITRVEDDALRDEEIIAALKDLFEGIDVKKSKIIASINCPMTALKAIRLPYMPRSELYAGINIEAKTYFPFPIDNSLLDFKVMKDTIDKGARKQDLVIAVSPRTTIDKYLSLAERAGIKMASLIPCSCALQEIGERVHPEGDKVTCLVDIGEKYAELLIFKGKTLVFTRKIPIAGGDFTKAMTGALFSERGKTELSLDEAEKTKREVGLPAEGAEPRIINNKISTTQVSAMLRTPSEQLANEISRCFDYYREETGGGMIESLVLSGGGASLGGLTGFISSELGIEVKLGDSTEGLNVDTGAINEKGSIAHRLFVALGAGLNDAKGINLLPPEIKEETKRTFTRAAIQATAVALILILGFVYTGMKIQLSNYQKRLTVSRMELASLQFRFKKAESHHLANVALAEEPHWEDVFKELSNLIPDDIYLTEIEMSNKSITMKGVASSKDSLEHLSDFILTLKNGIFSRVRLVGTKKLGSTGSNEFKLKCWVD